MYYNDYEDYMRSVLGYNVNNMNNMNNMLNTYDADYYMSNRMQEVGPTYQTERANMQLQDNIEDLYPDVYKIIYPMVCRVCQNNNKPITNDLIEQMTMEVYNNIEIDDINIININVETRSTNNMETKNKHIDNKDSRTSQENKELRKTEETRQRRPNNPLLRDLIRILILNRLLDRFRPTRPHVRPPFPRTEMNSRSQVPPMQPRYVQNNPEMQPQMGMYGFDNYYNY